MPDHAPPTARRRVRAPRRGVRGGLATATVLVTLLAAGCTSGPDPLDATVHATHTCTSDDVLAEWWQPGLRADPAPRALPADDAPFAPVAVVVCAVDYAVDDGGEVVAVVVTETRYEGDLGPVLRYLSQPSPRRQDSHPQCASIGAGLPPPTVWLVDAEGRGSTPRLPTDRCGFLRGGLEDAVGALEEADLVEHRLELDA